MEVRAPTYLIILEIDSLSLMTGIYKTVVINRQMNWRMLNDLK